jgi:UDPglucose--hexose-1-phosphate uridylyltransferase
MPELRKDPILDRWVIISTDRQKRSSDFFLREKPQTSGGFCPFCEGNESKTPSEILAHRENSSTKNGPGWSLRVVPNRFPALTIEGNLDREGVGMYDKMNGIGAHEVIIESPLHEETLATISIAKLVEVLTAYIERIVDLKKDKRFRYILIFKNHGYSAGASLEHSHSQLIALPIIPKRVLEELEGSKRHYSFKERCVYCDIIHQEISQRERIISENSSYIALSPFAPKAPFEIWILPKKHECAYDKEAPDRLESLARILSEVLKRLDKALGNPDFNFIIHTSPMGMENLDYFHWHIEIMPKLTKTAGFEWGSGFYINPISPEESTQVLKEAKI